MVEMKAYLNTLGETEKLGDAKSIFKSIDKNGNGSIDFDEFYEWHVATFDRVGLVKSEVANCKTREEIRQIFDLFDDDKSGEWAIVEMKARRPNVVGLTTDRGRSRREMRESLSPSIARGKPKRMEAKVATRPKTARGSRSA